MVYKIGFLHGQSEEFTNKQLFLKRLLNLHQNGYLFNINRVFTFGCSHIYLDKKTVGILPNLKALKDYIFQPYGSRNDFKKIEVNQY